MSSASASRSSSAEAGAASEISPQAAAQANRARQPYTPSTFNSPDFTEQVVTGFRERFGADRVKQVPSVMGGEDFGQFLRADPEGVKSLIFWVGGVPPEEFAKAEAGSVELPSLHSPFWAPDAEIVIATAAEALSSATLELLAPQSGV